jgi:single-stranded-DNA-specific exonuclease
VPPGWIAARVPPAAADLRSAGVPDRLAVLLAQRGIETAAEARRFLEPGLDHLHRPERLAGLAAAVARLAAASRAGETVAVLGDYDVDGISATAILVAVLRVAGAHPEPLVAHRHTEGYGFQAAHARRAAERGATLLVTVDCGTNSRAAAAAARELGLELIVVDHHLPDDGPLLEAILVNPRRPDCGYPYDELTGAGLALKLAAALLEALDRQVPWESLLRVACLGTIADVAPLTGENRVIAALGLEALGSSRSPGLRALIAAAGLRPPLRATDVGFRLAPRLNAAGRLGPAEPALDLLLERDPVRARALAQQLEALNRERQRIESTILSEARSAIEGRSATGLVVAWSEEWNRGVVGIAAARLVRELGRPVILLAVEGETATGSGRSVPGIHLHGFLGAWGERMERFGGHAQAIGLTVRRDRLEELRRDWEAASRDWPAHDPEAERRYDLDLGPAELGPSLLEEIERLEPFGPGNEAPIFRVGPLRRRGAARRFGRGHGALLLELPGGDEIEAVGWGWGERLGSAPEWLEVLAGLERDRWRGGVRLRLEALRPAAPNDVRNRIDR